MRKYRFVLGFLAGVLFISCNDNNPDISEGLFGKDRMNVKKDSLVGLDIEAFTISDENAVTSHINYGLLGVNNDAKFGKTKSGFAFQLRTPGKYVFEEEGITEDDITVDSAFLNLAYNKAFGDSTVVQHLNVYRLNRDLVFGDKYRANELSRLGIGEKLTDQDFNYEILADSTVVVTRDTLDIKSKKDTDQDSIQIKIDTLVSAYLQVKLPKEDIQRIFIEETTPDDYEGQDEFLDYFKGVYVDVDDNSLDGGLYSFYLDNANKRTFLSIYYSFPSPVKADSTVNRLIGFESNENSSRVNFISHDFTGSEVQDVLGDKGEVASESDEVYVIGAAGTKGKIYIPKINDWKDSTDIAINKAELIFSTATDSIYNENNPVPEKLVLVALDKDDNPGKIIDYDLPTFGGTYNKKDQTYRFNITFYLQKIIKDKGATLNHGFLLYPTRRKQDPRRVIIANPKNVSDKDKRIKLSITYTKI